MNIESDLKEIEKKYRDRRIESHQLEKILNEQFIQTFSITFQVMKKFGMKLDVKKLQNIFISYSHVNKEIVH